jgi:hypothetical protein
MQVNNMAFETRYRVCGPTHMSALANFPGWNHRLTPGHSESRRGKMLASTLLLLNEL